LTRYHNGLTREKHLTKIIALDDEWIPLFVVQLVGEYVIEILQVVGRNLDFLNRSLYRRFLLENSPFFALI
jgi:hypothetical protein